MRKLRSLAAAQPSNPSVDPMPRQAPVRRKRKIKMVRNLGLFPLRYYDFLELVRGFPAPTCFTRFLRPAPEV
jgi:hypothetical protein